MQNVLEELEQAQQLAEVEEAEGEFEADSSEIYDDLIAALSLLKKCSLVFAYTGDTEIHKTLSKRERELLTRMAGDVQLFVRNVETSYDDVGDLA